MIKYIDGPCCWNRAEPSLLRERAFGGASTWRNYSTARCLDGSDPEIIYTEDFPELEFHTGLQVEILSKEILCRWKDLGLHFANENHLNDTGFRDAFARSLDLIRMVEPILGTVAGLCRSVHVLLSSDMYIDSSYTDPRLPFSVFVSCPLVTESHRVERLAESIAHEALHLQLSLVERFRPLTEENSTQRMVFSPWKKEHRTVQGLLHGIYVFGNLRCFWTRIAGRATEYSSFAETRIEGIDNELGDAKEILANSSLTMFGRRLATSLLKFR